ncbi:hypothetical protein [Sphingomonas sp. MA1305]|uniref:hypothetical protein n=1 Tax=Sphingomonas sp. MA1305 TaxID=2479204 RepID=UPI0018DF88A8|nr:hypothetical protein [Sphingomonas sp. MA1305]
MTTWRDIQRAIVADHSEARTLTFDSEASEGPYREDSGLIAYNLGVSSFFIYGAKVGKFTDDRFEELLTHEGQQRFRDWLPLAEFIIKGEVPPPNNPELRALVAKEYSYNLDIYERVGLRHEVHWFKSVEKE